MHEVSDNELGELVNFMATEHFAAEFFRDLERETRDPVLSNYSIARFCCLILARRPPDLRLSRPS